MSPEESEADQIEKERNTLLLRMGFAAWKPDGKLSTTNFLKSSIARILMRSEAAMAGGKPVASSNELPASAKARGVSAPESFTPEVDATIEAMDGYFKW